MFQTASPSSERTWTTLDEPRAAPAGAAPQAAQLLTNARVLLIDDEERNLVLLRGLLENAGYRFIAATSDSTKALALYHEFQPDVICLDLNMPGLDGYDVLRQLATVIPANAYLPVLMLTGDSSAGAKQQALALGAKDFVTKPFNGDEVRLRIHNLLVPRFMHLELQQQNVLLEERVRQRTIALEEARMETLERLARAAEFRDDDTGQHTKRVGRGSQLLAEALGLPPEMVELIARAAPLHDIGKIGISDSVLLKPGKLTAEEYALMKTHAVIGSEILAGGRTPLMQLAQTIALHHHERWDGAGYPHGLRESDIPLPARIVALADFFDALSHDRPYRRAWPLADVLREISAQSGHHFDPRVAAAFARLPHDELF
jgi:putative two-component system response regulator